MPIRKTRDGGIEDEETRRLLDALRARIVGDVYSAVRAGKGSATVVAHVNALPDDDNAARLCMAFFHALLSLADKTADGEALMSLGRATVAALSTLSRRGTLAEGLFGPDVAVAPEEKTS
jgi:hypothetical protein